MLLIIIYFERGIREIFDFDWAGCGPSSLKTLTMNNTCFVYLYVMSRIYDYVEFVTYPQTVFL